MPPEEKGPSPNVWTWLTEIAIASAIFLIVVFFLGNYLGIGYDRYRAILAWLYGFWATIRPVVMVITILVSIGLVGFIAVIFRRFIALSARLPAMVVGARKIAEAPKGTAEKEITDEWQEVRKLADSENASDWNMAVLRADALLDDVLQHLGHEGTTVKERLDTADPTMVPSLDRLYSAHRLRNLIAHDPTVPHSKDTLMQVLRAYEQGFKEFGVLREGGK